jgi:hypothetical protein
LFFYIRTRARHFYTGSGQLCAKKAIEIATRRDPSIKKTTIFQEPSEFWLCDSKEKYGAMEVVVSPKPVRTYQCVRQEGVWTAHYLGVFNVVLTDEGNQFPGFLIKTVFFPK